MADVFISYAHKDENFARKLRDRLEEHKRKTWIDEEDIPLTTEWQKEVFAGIESADTFAFIISPDSIESNFCRMELVHAVQNNKRLAPIWHRDVEDEEVIPPELRSHQW